MSDPGSLVSPPGNSRRQRALIEPVELFTRMAMCGFGPNPTGGLAQVKPPLVRATLNTTARRTFTFKHVPLAPIPGLRTTHGIESKDYSVGKRDYS